MLCGTFILTFVVLGGGLTRSHLLTIISFGDSSEKTTMARF
jgi:hypothetical protein